VDEAGGWGGGDGDYWVERVYVVADDLAIEIPISNLMEHGNRSGKSLFLQDFHIFIKFNVIPHQTIVATMAGPLNPPILGDFEAVLARKSPRIRPFGQAPTVTAPPTPNTGILSSNNGKRRMDTASKGIKVISAPVSRNASNS
jgi:hypothetical protein